MRLAKQLPIWIGLGLAILAFVRDCAQDDRIASLTYETSANSFRPYLRVIETPPITGFKLNFDAAPLLSMPGQTQPDTVDVPTSITITREVALVNTGNTPAHIAFVIWKDTLSGSAKLRDLVLDEESRAELVLSRRESNYWEHHDVAPGDTVSWSFSHLVKFVSNHEFTMHFLFLYMNDTGALFDTYYWVRYRTGGEFVARPDFMVENGTLLFRMITDGSMNSWISQVDDNESTKLYSSGELGFVQDFLDSVVDANP